MDLSYTNHIPRKPPITYYSEYDPRILRYVHYWELHVQREEKCVTGADAPFAEAGIIVTCPVSLFWRWAYVKSRHPKRYSRYKAWKAKRELRAEYKRWYNAYVENGRLKIIDSDEHPGGMSRA